MGGQFFCSALCIGVLTRLNFEERSDKTSVLDNSVSKALLKNKDSWHSFMKEEGPTLEWTL